MKILFIITLTAFLLRSCNGQQTHSAGARRNQQKVEQNSGRNKQDDEAKLALVPSIDAALDYSIRQSFIEQEGSTRSYSKKLENEAFFGVYKSKLIELLLKWCTLEELGFFSRDSTDAVDPELLEKIEMLIYWAEHETQKEFLPKG